MARYNLYLKDTTYMKLMKMCIEKGGLSMGRLLNDIVDRAVEDTELEIKTQCRDCDQPAIYEVFVDEKRRLVCLEHYTEGVPNWKTWKRL